MKASRRNIAKLAAQAQAKPPKLSKYALKRMRELGKEV